MNKIGAGLISIFLCTLLIFCSFSFPVYADDYGWHYGDSYINSVSTENKELYFVPIAPDSVYSDYMIIQWNNHLYIILGNGDFLVFGNGGIQKPSTTELYIYDDVSNNWEPTEYPREIFGLPAFDRSMVFIDCTSNVEFWGAGTSIQQKPYINRTGYRIYWNLALILINILNILEYISDYIIQHDLVFYLCVGAFVGELFIFLIILFRRIGEMRSEEVNL